MASPNLSSLELEAESVLILFVWKYDTLSPSQNGVLTFKTFCSRPSPPTVSFCHNLPSPVALLSITPARILPPPSDSLLCTNNPIEDKQYLYHGISSTSPRRMAPTKTCSPISCQGPARLEIIIQGLMTAYYSLLFSLCLNRLGTSLFGTQRPTSQLHDMSCSHTAHLSCAAVRLH